MKMAKQHAEYGPYRAARRHCNDTKLPDYKYYGGRGIQFKFKTFWQFYAEVGARPEGCVLDRKDNDGHYEPGNVRWATRSESNRNKRYPISNTGHKGVTFSSGWYWATTDMVDGKRRKLKKCRNLQKAIAARQLYEVSQ